jgi:hypothetical protein
MNEAQSPGAACKVQHLLTEMVCRATAGPQKQHRQLEEEPHSYVIKFVSKMGKAVDFYRDVRGLQFKLESPEWMQFVTGETTLALHPASDKNPARKVELGFTVADLEIFYQSGAEAA